MLYSTYKFWDLHGGRGRVLLPFNVYSLKVPFFTHLQYHPTLYTKRCAIVRMTNKRTPKHVRSSTKGYCLNSTTNRTTMYGSGTGERPDSAHSTEGETSLAPHSPNYVHCSKFVAKREIERAKKLPKDSKTPPASLSLDF